MTRLTPEEDAALVGPAVIARDIEAGRRDAFVVRVTWRNDNPATIWNQLAAKLGREPTPAEAKAEVQRILAEARDDR